jgi:organic radical activating enzyme
MTNGSSLIFPERIHMQYPVVETFFSIQGEGKFVGNMMNFIRLAGCPINCEFCDTDKSAKRSMDPHLLAISMTKGFPVVITGGEPCIHDLKPLVEELRCAHFSIHLETSGAFPIRSTFDYVAVSPKKSHHFTQEAAREANEVKWLVPLWTLEEIQTLMGFFDNAVHFIQPINDFATANSRNVSLAMKYATELKLPISVQMHKLLRVR